MTADFAAPDDATRAQNRASDPMVSTWLSANAGSGKTKVLTDRVARLLLRGVAPQQILCLTYTKAAASEMQNRLFRLLGDWAMRPDAELRAALAAIGEDGGTPAQLAEARRLFARAIETPGGLKIQTIHSFCAALLRRFPLEAGLSPAFTEMDARAARALRAEVLDTLAAGPHADAVARFAEHFTGAELEPLLAEICDRAHLFDAPAPGHADFALPEGLTMAGLADRVVPDDAAALLRELPPVLDGGTTTDVKHAAKLRALAPDRRDATLLGGLEALLLTGKDAKTPFAPKTGKFPTKATRTRLGARCAVLDSLMDRVAEARPQRLALAALARAQALHGLARPFLAAYGAAKAARGWLDFDDLITRTDTLLTDPSVAAWVLFKLDGGVDHVLVDEAQDTSPAQWRVIAHLTQEFTAGQGARDVARTLFVVGDKKQSIYSFQGADLAVFDRVKADFAARLADAGIGLAQAELAHSFRSSDAVLRCVDMTFRAPHADGLGGAPAHLAFHPDRPGRVDVWPPVLPDESGEPPDWFDPVDAPSDAHHHRRLARAIAAELRGLIDAGTLLPDGDDARPMDEGDVLILVRKRNTLFHEIIAACKAAGLAIAGADRLRLGGEMAVRDLTALLRVLATPEDDLSLAACLRAPLCGWTEDDLYRLAQGRARGEFLWARLRAAADGGTARAMLDDLRMQADFLRPYDLVERCLTRHDGRRRLISRLGPEAEDGIDAFLAQALAYEQAETPSLTGFLAWLERDEVELKRELDTAGRMLRVMTVHGAKGLEAPVVILPDTAEESGGDRAAILDIGGRAAWPGAVDAHSAPEQAARDARQTQAAQESARLLYVAMTRAENWLIVAGAGKVAAPDCWYQRASAGVAAAGAVTCDTPTGAGQRHAHGAWPVAATADAPVLAHAAPPLPDALFRPLAAPPPDPGPVNPSQLGGAKALPGEGGDAADAALERGTQLHLLLEHLPGVAHAQWPDAAAALLGDTVTADALLPEARAVLDAPALAEIFAPDTLAEVEIAGTLDGAPLLGTIDRLLVRPDHVLAVDYKSNRVIPDTARDVPDGLLRQMGAYQAALEQVYPDRAVSVALLWTRAARLMPLPADLLRAALAGA